MATTANHQAVPCTISARRASMLCLYCSLAAVCSRKLHSTPSAIVLYCAACCSARVSCSCKSTTHQIYLRQQPMSAAPANLQRIKSTFVNNRCQLLLQIYNTSNLPSSTTVSAANYQITVSAFSVFVP